MFSTLYLKKFPIVYCDRGKLYGLILLARPNKQDSRAVRGEENVMGIIQRDFKLKINIYFDLFALLYIMNSLFVLMLYMHFIIILKGYK